MARNLVCLNANDPQMGQVMLFVKTLRDSQRGDFKGDIFVITTGLSATSKKWLEENNVGIFERSLSALDNAPFSKGIADFQQYKNKHFSKLLVIDLLEQVGAKYEKVLLCDGDIIFQNPIKRLFLKIDTHKIYAGEEVNSIAPGTGIWHKNKLAENLPIHKYLQYGEGAHEINVGYLAGKTSSMLDLCREWKKLMFNNRELSHLFYIHSSKVIPWHEQDFMRLYRDMNIDKFQMLDKDYILHVCSGGETLIEEKDNLVFHFKDSEKLPDVVHFCGGTGKYYRSITEAYGISDSPSLAYESKPKRGIRRRISKYVLLRLSQSKFVKIILGE